MLMMMGTVGELPQAPKEKVVFMEDMSDSQLAATVRKKFCITHSSASTFISKIVWH